MILKKRKIHTFNKYSTALSGLLKLALNAAITCVLGYPILIISWTVVSYSLPVTKLPSAISGCTNAGWTGGVTTGGVGTTGAATVGVTTGVGAGAALVVGCAAAAGWVPAFACFNK